MVLLRRNSIDFGCLTQWRSDDQSTVSNEIEFQPEKLEHVPIFDIKGFAHQLERHPLLESKLKAKSSEKKHRQHLDWDNTTLLPEHARENILAKHFLNTELERIISEELDKKVEDLEKALTSIPGLTRKISYGIVELEHLPEADSPPHPNDINSEEYETRLETLMQKYEQEQMKWESMLSDTCACLINESDDSGTLEKDKIGCEGDNDDLPSEEIALPHGL